MLNDVALSSEVHRIFFRLVIGVDSGNHYNYFLIFQVKKKKRWSQIMYMSYVLDFLSKQHVDKDGNPMGT